MSASATHAMAAYATTPMRSDSVARRTEKCGSLSTNHTAAVLAAAAISPARRPKDNARITTTASCVAQPANWFVVVDDNAKGRETTTGRSSPTTRSRHECRRA